MCTQPNSGKSSTESFSPEVAQNNQMGEKQPERAAELCVVSGRSYRPKVHSWQSGFSLLQKDQEPIDFLKIYKHFFFFFCAGGGKFRPKSEDIFFQVRLCCPQAQIHVCVDEAHCGDTSRSLRLMIRRHSKATSREQGCNSALVKQLLYRSDVSIQHLTELASLACTLWYLWDVYWVLNTHCHKMWIAWQSMMHTEVKEQGTDQTLLCYNGASSHGTFFQTWEIWLTTVTKAPKIEEKGGTHHYTISER